MDNVRILITGAGAPGVRGTLYALRNSGMCGDVRVVGVDARCGVAGKFLCDAFHTVPAPEDRGYLRRLMEIAKGEGVQIILPQTTREVAALSTKREELNSEGIQVVVGSPEAIAAANDKCTVMETFREIGLPFPQFHIARSEEDLCCWARQLGYPEQPVAIKPTVSNGMRGFRILQENAWNAKRFLAEKPSGVEITLDDLLAILRSGVEWPELLVMEYLPGPEYSVDAFIGSRARVAIPRLRREIRSGISFITECEPREDMIEYTLRAADRLGLRYAFGFQYKLDSAGVPKVLECNPRVQGTMVASVFTGVNVIWLAICEAMGFPQHAKQAQYNNVEFFRFWGGIGVSDGQAFEI